MRQLIRSIFLLSFVLISLASYSQSKVIALDDAGFKEKVYDFEKEKTWVFKGDKPVIVDFYANWLVLVKELLQFLLNCKRNMVMTFKFIKLMWIMLKMWQQLLI